MADNQKLAGIIPRDARGRQKLFRAYESARHMFEMLAGAPARGESTPEVEDYLSKFAYYAARYPKLYEKYPGRDPIDHAEALRKYGIAPMQPEPPKLPPGTGILEGLQTILEHDRSLLPPQGASRPARKDDFAKELQRYLWQDPDAPYLRTLWKGVEEHVARKREAANLGRGLPFNIGEKATKILNRVERGHAKFLRTIYDKEFMRAFGVK